MFNRNFIILFISQIFSSAPPAITILLSGIIGSSLIEIKYLATLPTGIMVGGIAVSSVFASNIMAHKGRRFGFCLGSIVGTLAALCCAYSVYIENFNLLPKDWYKNQQYDSKHRIICDYISGMTDRYASKLYKSIYE